MQGALLEKHHLGPQKLVSDQPHEARLSEVRRLRTYCAHTYAPCVMMPTDPQATGLHFKTRYSLPFQKLSVYFHNMQQVTQDHIISRNSKLVLLMPPWGTECVI